MALFLGEAVRIKAKATDPETGEALDPAPTSAVVDFWAPGLDRKVDDPTIEGVTMTYRPTTDDFILYQSTDGAPWVIGKWTYKVTMTGAVFVNWEYSNFTLKA